ncbi:MAG: hypothetical protein KDA91_05270 [Planctomycetaceae bacterium]|nr:hypothetical protein [Planctomycetaceae bacterium]
MSLVSLAALRGSACSAGLIAFAGNGPNASPNGPTTTGVINSAVLAQNGANNGTVGTFTSTVTAWAKPDLNHGGFELSFGYVDLGVAGTKTYNFAVTVNNSVGQGLSSPVQPSAVGDDIQNIEFEIVRTGLAAGTVTFAVANAGPAGPFIYTNGGGNQVLRFGGTNGGGVAIPNGGSHTFNFDVLVADGDAGGSFGLRVIANPEPGTMLLAAMTLIPGGIAVRRRRQAKVQCS